MTQEEKAKAYDEALERARKMLNIKLKQYLWIEFSHSTIPKYYKYFEEWFSNLTENQILFYTAYMNGLKTLY